MSTKEKLLAWFTKAVDGMPPEFEEKKEEMADEQKAKMKKLADEKEAADKAKDTAEKARDEAISAAKQAADALAAVQKTVDALTTQVAEMKAGTKANDAKVTYDADTIAAAEILAPGCAKDSATMKVDALKAAYATADGKKAIDAMTGGKAPAYDSSQVVDILFTAVSSAVADERKKALAGKTAPTKTGDTQTQDFYTKFAEDAAKLHPVPKF